MLSFFPRDVLDEILNLIESVSEGFPFYSTRIRSWQVFFAALCAMKYHGDQASNKLMILFPFPLSKAPDHGQETKTKVACPFLKVFLFSKDNSTG